MADPERFEELLGEQIAGALDAAGRAELERLVEADPGRRRLLAELAAETRLLPSALRPAGALTAGVLAELRQRQSRFRRRVMESARRKSPFARRKRANRLWWLGGLLAAAAAAVVVALLWTHPAQPPAHLMAITQGTVERQGGSLPGRPGLELHAGDIVVSAVGGSAEVGLADGTRIRLAADSRLTLADPGQALALGRGTAVIDAAPQPPGRPLVLRSGDCAATVVGTRFRLSRGATGTDLDVSHGRVRFQGATGEAVAVDAGRTAQAAVGGSARLDPPWPAEVTICFGPPEFAAPGPARLDSGAPFDPRRGFGWDDPPHGGPVPGVLMNGRPVDRERAGVTQRIIDDSRCGARLSTGWVAFPDTWRCRVPDGHYLITICGGDPENEQGPHRVVVQGQVAVENRITAPGEFFRVVDLPVTVEDGVLVMTTGGGNPTRVSADGTNDTILCYLLIRRVD